MGEKIINRITEWLEKYKVWFETVMCLALTLCAIFLSFQANEIAKKQYNYDTVKEQEHFVINGYYDNDLSNYGYVLNNTGGELKECNIFVEHYIKLKLSNNEKYIFLLKSDSNITKEHIENNDFLPFYFSYPNLPGNKPIRESVYNFIELMDYKSFEVEYISYLTVNYVNIQNKRKIKYFCVNSLNSYEINRNQLPDYKKCITISIDNKEDFEDNLTFEIYKMYNDTNQ